MGDLAPRTPRALGELLPLMTIRARYFGNMFPLPSLRWVASQMPAHQRVRVGKSFAWWTADIEDALRQMRGAA